MLQSIYENIQTLLKAMGKEPISQIITNGFRKIIGLEPVLETTYNPYSEKDKQKNYLKYLERRTKILGDSRIGASKCEFISIILKDCNSDSHLNSALQTLHNQRISPNGILIVSEKAKDGYKCFSNLNDAISNVDSDYICITDTSNKFHPCFIQELMHKLVDEKIDVLHTCYDYQSGEGRREPCWLPQLNLHLLYSNNYIGETITIKRKFGERLEWFYNDVYENSYIYDFILRSIDADASFYCIPDVLFSIVKETNVDTIAERKEILEQHLKRNSWQGEVVEGLVPYSLRIKWSVPQNKLISIIIPFKDKVELLKSCVNSILQKTEYSNYEIILADNRSQKKDTLDFVGKLVEENINIKHIYVDMDFNYSAINNYAVSKCKGEFLLFLNNDTEVINSIWLTEMLMELQGPKVGVVGAKLLYGDNTIQHAGILCGVGHVAGHAFRYLHEEESGHMNRANLVQEYLAVTGACLLTKRNLFRQVSGFDEVNLAIAYNDVDICLKIRQLGFKIIYSPFSKLYHFESKSRENDLNSEQLIRYKKECSYILGKWDKTISMYKFYHPHLDLNYEDFRIALNENKI